MRTEAPPASHEKLFMHWLEWMETHPNWDKELFTEIRGGNNSSLLTLEVSQLRREGK